MPVSPDPARPVSDNPASGGSSADGASADEASADSAYADGTATIDRVWELRRRTEKRPCWQRPAVGVLAATGFTLITNPALFPGGLAVSLSGLVVVVAVAVIAAVVAVRRASLRGHSGSIKMPEPPGHRWWRSPALAGPAVFTVVFLGNIVGAFAYWSILIATAVLVGIALARILPRYETADHIAGSRLQTPPELTAETAAALSDGSLTPDVLELLVLQHHTGERRISWCADVLGTDAADIRDRIARGRRWLELPATEVHAPATASWVRLSGEGRRALSYA